MAKIENLKPNQIGLIAQDEDGNIYQIGLNEMQRLMVEACLSACSKDEKLIRLPKEYDLTLKNE